MIAGYMIYIYIYMMSYIYIAPIYMGYIYIFIYACTLLSPTKISLHNVINCNIFSCGFGLIWVLWDKIYIITYHLKQKYGFCT